MHRRHVFPRKTMELSAICVIWLQPNRPTIFLTALLMYGIRYLMISLCTFCVIFQKMSVTVSLQRGQLDPKIQIQGVAPTNYFALIVRPMNALQLCRWQFSHKETL